MGALHGAGGEGLVRVYEGEDTILALLCQTGLTSLTVPRASPPVVFSFSELLAVRVHLGGAPGDLGILHGAGGVGRAKVGEREDTVTTTLRQARVSTCIMSTISIHQDHGLPRTILVQNKITHKNIFVFFITLLDNVPLYVCL